MKAYLLDGINKTPLSKLKTFLSNFFAIVFVIFIIFCAFLLPIGCMTDVADGPLVAWKIEDKYIHTSSKGFFTHYYYKLSLDDKTETCKLPFDEWDQHKAGDTYMYPAYKVTLIEMIVHNGRNYREYEKDYGKKSD